MSKRRVIPGVHIQWPWSQLIIEGKKTIETRAYPIPKKHIGKEIAIIETPGPRGAKEAGILKARIVGTVIFSSCKQYQTFKEWKRDCPAHLVLPTDSQFAYSSLKPKWGWIVARVTKLETELPAPTNRGIVFASECEL